MAEQATTVRDYPCGVINDPERLHAVRRAALLDTPGEEAFDRLARLASKILNTPIALISLLDSNRLFFKSSIGLPDSSDVRELPLNQTFCQYNVTLNRALIIEDARTHDLVHDHPAVASFNVRGYLGVPLLDNAGHGLGALCVIDTQPRAWSTEQVEILGALGASIVTEIELRVTARETAQAHAQAIAAEQRLSQLMQNLDAIVWEADVERGCFTFVNQSAVAILGYTVEHWLVTPSFWEEHLHPDDRVLVLAAGLEGLNSGKDYEVEYRALAADGRVVWMHDKVRVIQDALGSPLWLRGLSVDITRRKTAEAEVQKLNRELEESLGELQTLMEVMPIGIAIAHDPECREMTANPALADLVGIDSERNISKSGADADALPFTVLRDGHIVPVAESPMQTAAARGVRIINAECDIVRADGKLLHILINAAPLFDSHGQVRGCIGALIDITQRKRVEQALVESERNLWLIAQNTTDAVFAYDLDHRLLFVNSAFETLTGYGIVELREHHYIDYVHPEDALRIRALLDDVYRGVAFEGAEFRIVTRCGKTKWCLSTWGPLLDQNGIQIGVQGREHDITARRGAEQARRESEARFGVLADTAPVLIWMSDADAMHTFFNKPWLEFTGRGISQEGGEDWTKYLHPDDAARCLERYRTAFQARRELRREYRLRRHDGEYRWLLDNAVPRYTPDGEFSGYIGSCIDITESKQTEIQLRTLTSQLERSNRELQEFATIASHDLQEPLRKIQTFCDRLMTSSSGKLSLRDQDYLNRMRKAAARMQNLIGDLLVLSRLSDQSRPFKKMNLRQSVYAAMTDLELVIKDTGGQILVGDLPTVEADPVQMQQLLLNLLGNALKFHRPDVAPQVKIEACILNPGPNDAASHAEEALCRLTVTDNGIGFDAQYKERIFAVFERLHGQEYFGTGIGLTLCRKIVERHGGDISAESIPGQGATFIVILPVAHPPPPPNDAAAYHTVRQG